MTQWIRIAMCGLVFCMSVFNFKFAYIVFKKKTKVFYLIIVCTITNCILEIVILLIASFNLLLPLHIAKWLILFFSMLMLCYLWIWRIRSLGGQVRFENLLIYILFSYIVVGLAIVFIFAYQFETKLSNYIMQFPTLIVRGILELFLFYLLICKINLMFEYRSTLRTKLIKKTVVWNIVAVFSEVAVVITGFYPDNKMQLDPRFGRGLSLSIRLCSFIDFYRDIVVCFNRPHSLSFQVMPSEIVGDSKDDLNYVLPVIRDSVQGSSKDSSLECTKSVS